LDLGTAQTTLIGAGFAKGNIKATASTSCAAVAPAGVFAQNPVGGSVIPKTSLITLSYRPAACASYPSVIRAPYTRAITALKNAGFTNVTADSSCSGAITYVPSVISQSPPVGNGFLMVNTPITLTCQLG
jgi:beta-lactam-binding protein with PASTA domain